MHVHIHLSIHPLTRSARALDPRRILLGKGWYPPPYFISPLFFFSFPFFFSLSFSNPSKVFLFFFVFLRRKNPENAPSPFSRKCPPPPKVPIPKDTCQNLGVTPNSTSLKNADSLDLKENMSHTGTIH